jgi:hypothetical protein
MCDGLISWIAQGSNLHKETRHDDDSRDRPGQVHFIEIQHSGAANLIAPTGHSVREGGQPTQIHGLTNVSAVPSYNSANIDQPMWARITCDGTDIQVRCATSEAGLASASVAYQTTASTDRFPIEGGRLGITGSLRGVVIGPSSP